MGLLYHTPYWDMPLMVGLGRGMEAETERGKGDGEAGEDKETGAVGA